MRRTIAMIAVIAFLGGCAGRAATSGGPSPTTAAPSRGSSPAAASVEAPASAAPKFDPIALKGKGKKVVKFSIPEDVAAIAVLKHKGKSNFIVDALDANGKSLGALVNEIGNYSGTVLFDTDADQHTAAFAVDADGTWTITVKPVASAPAWDPSKTLKGTGDSVYQVSPASSGLVVVDLTFKGDGNFIVDAYTPEGREGIANEIGNFTGQVPLPDGTYLLDVIANGGAWTVKPG
jgi:hypothetical protein